MKKSYFIAICVFCFFSLSAFVKGRTDDPIYRLISALKQIEDSKPIEKLHLSFDKSYYAAGDTVWFKAFLLAGAEHKLSGLSGVVYVELINSHDSLLYRHRLPVFAGAAKGDFVLSSRIEPGAYRVRAYTEWMRNSENEFFFDKVLNVGSYTPQSIASSISYKYSKEKVNAAISFYENNQPYAGKEVTYKIRNINGDTYSGKGTTTASGRIEISFKGADYRTKTSWIETVIDLGKGKRSIASYPLKQTYSEPDITFFPESGSLVVGLTSRVAIKCVGREGAGLNVEGVVYDDKNNEITSFQCLHAGMGMFKLTPEAGRSYFAEVKHSDGYIQKVKLPQAASNGLVLSVYSSVDPDSVLIRISSDSSYYQGNGKALYLIGNSSGKVNISSSLIINQPLTSLKIAKKMLPTGIAQFTLLTETGEPLCERLAFIWHDDQIRMECKTDKAIYNSKEKVKFTLTSQGANSPKVGSFSVAVINESMSPANEAWESNIFSNIFLASELKGYIENPHYYFSKVTAKTLKDLDLLMMTQGYRKFVWKEAFNNGAIYKPAFRAEKIATSITGRLTNLSNKPVENGKMTMFSHRAGLLLDTLTNTNGEFSFKPLLLTDSVKITIQGRTASNSDKVKLQLYAPSAPIINFNKNLPDVAANVNDSLKAYLNPGAKEYEVLKAKGLLNRTFELQDVIVSVRRSQEKEISSNLNGAGHADQVLMGDAQLEACPSLSMCLHGRLTGVVFREGIAYSTRDAAFSHPMLLVVNRKQVVAEDPDYAEYMEQGGINPTDIYSIEVLRTPIYTNVYGPAGSNGVIILNLKPGALAIGRQAFGIATYRHNGFYKAREFYTPKYEKSDSSVKYTAPRSTVYWNPGVVTSAEGVADIEFFTENPGSYRVLVEGVDEDGRLGRQIFKFQVKN